MKRKPTVTTLTRFPKGSDPEERLAWIISVLGPEAIAGAPVREHRPLPPRRWRLDFAWPSLRVGIEVQGGVRSRGPSGHKGSGQIRDMEKLNALQTSGWIVLQFPTERIVRDPTGVAEEIRAALRRICSMPRMVPAA